MTWNFVGEHTFTPSSAEVNIGEFNLSEGQDTIWARVTQLNEPGDWPFSFGILSWRSSEGNELGSIKIFPTQFGEVFRLTCGRAPLVGAGSIWFEPRGYNLQWIKAGYPWTLKFEASAGRGSLENQIWERAADTIFPVNEGDDLDMKGGCITSGCLKVQPPDEQPRDIPSTQEGVWSPAPSKGSATFAPEITSWTRISNLVTVRGFMYNFDSRDQIRVEIRALPYNVAVGQVAGGCMYTYAKAGYDVIYAGDTPNSLGGYLTLYQSSAAGWDELKYSNITGSVNLYFFATYMTDDASWKPINGASVVSNLAAYLKEQGRRRNPRSRPFKDPATADLELEAL